MDCLDDHRVRIRGFLHGLHPRKKIRIHREYSCLSWCLFNVAITGVKAKVETLVKTVVKTLVKARVEALLEALGGTVVKTLVKTLMKTLENAILTAIEYPL